MTTKAEIREWLANAPDGATHLIVACDQFDWEDFPVYWPVTDQMLLTAQPGLADKSLREVIGYYQSAPLSSVDEVYDLRLDHESQLAEPVAWHLDTALPTDTHWRS